MGEDKFTLTTLEDGTVRVETEGISGVNHVSADAFMEMMDGHLGNPAVVTQKKKHHHHHEHAHEHAHKRN